MEELKEMILKANEAMKLIDDKVFTLSEDDRLAEVSDLIVCLDIDDNFREYLLDCLNY